MLGRSMVLSTAAAIALAAAPVSAQAPEKVKVAASFVGLWDTSQPTFCKDRGEFAKAGLDVEITSTRGGSETVQAVTAGGMDIGYSPGTNAVMAAFMQGAALRIISSQFIGQNDTFMYVKADSPIRTIADLAGKKVAYPRPGGASEAMLLALKAERKMDFQLVATGGLDATHTMLMTNQVDVGYSFPPYGIERALKGETRILFAGDAAETQKNITNRVNIARTEFVKNRRAVAQKFMATLDSCVNWMYANPEPAAKMYADLSKVSIEVAREAMKYYSRAALAFAPIKGLDESVKQAIQFKFIDKAPSADQLKEMVDIVYQPSS